MSRRSYRAGAVDGCFLVYSATTGVNTAIGYSLRLPPAEVSLEELKAHLAARMHLLPALRQRPVRRRATTYWCPTARFTIDDHVFERRVSADESVEAVVEELRSAPFPSAVPLWQLWLLIPEQGASPQRSGPVVLLRAHHAAFDGSALAVTLSTLFGQSAPVGLPPSPAAVRRSTTRSWLFAARELANAPRPGHVLPPSPAPLTGRAIPSLAQVDEQRLRQVAQATASSVNDVYLATVAGAVHHWLTDNAATWQGPVPRRLSALVPIGFHRPGESTGQGNRITALRVPLPIGPLSAQVRLALVRRTAGRILPPPAHRGAARLLSHTLPEGFVLPLFLRFCHPGHACMMLSNMPPLAPLSVLGQPVVQAVFRAFLYQGHPLGFYLARHRGQAVVTCLADSAIPNAADLADHWTRAFEDLQARTAKQTR
ncbi:wax ester/triacylglycerol synthase domain-containing protein [Spirillospora sp. NPDC127200]